MPSISTLVWLALVPRMNTEVDAARTAGLDDVEARHVLRDIGQGALLLALDVLGGDDRDAAADFALPASARGWRVTTTGGSGRRRRRRFLRAGAASNGERGTAKAEHRTAERRAAARTGTGHQIGLAAT